MLAKSFGERLYRSSIAASSACIAPVQLRCSSSSIATVQLIYKSYIGPLPVLFRPSIAHLELLCAILYSSSIARMAAVELSIASLSWRLVADGAIFRRLAPSRLGGADSSRDYGLVCWWRYLRTGLPGASGHSRD